MDDRKTSGVYGLGSGSIAHHRLSSIAAALMVATGVAVAQQAPLPAVVASEANLSDSVKKQAASPYKWILLNNNNVRAPKKDAPKDPAPSAAASAAPATAATVGNSTVAAAAAAARRAEVFEAARVAAAASAAAAAAPIAAAPVPVVAALVAPPPVVVAAVAPPPPRPLQPPPPPPPAPKKVNTELVVLTQVEPRLTPSMLRDITQGSVKVSFLVNPDGSTADVKVDSSTSRSLNGPVMAAVREWKYKPIDIPQRTEIELAFKFD